MTPILCVFLAVLQSMLVFSSLLAIQHGSPPVRRFFAESQGYKPLKQRFSPRFLQKAHANVTISLENATLSRSFSKENKENETLSRRFAETADFSANKARLAENEQWSLQNLENKAVEVYDVYQEYYQHFSTQISNNNEIRNLFLLTIVIFGLILVIFCRNCCWERAFPREKPRKAKDLEGKAEKCKKNVKKSEGFLRNREKFCEKNWEKGYEAEESEETEENDALEKVFNDLEGSFQRNGEFLGNNVAENEYLDDSLHIDIESFMRELEKTEEKPHFADFSKENCNILEGILEENIK